MARKALFIASSAYGDPELAQLPSAARDAVELGEVFSDPAIGQFAVTALENPSAHEMRLALDDLFAEAASGDLVVLYISGHGLKDMRGNLYFAANDTKPDRLLSTAVSAQLLCSMLNDSRAEGAVVFLDCCYGGAFARGMVARAAGDPQVGEAFVALGAGARARAVITASSAIEYAFEGDRLTDSHIEPSGFASAMRDGIAGGDADADGDGWVGLNELFDFIGQRIRRLGRPQTPHLWTFGASEDLRLTRSPQGPRASVTALPEQIRELLTSPLPAARLGAVTDLRQRAGEAGLATARAAVAAIVRLTEDDSLQVRAAAGEALIACAPTLDPAALTVRAGGTARLRLSGPPIALDVFAEAPPDGVIASVEDETLVVRLTEAAPPGEYELGLRWAGGTVPVRLLAEGEPAPAAASAEAPEDTPDREPAAAGAARADPRPPATAPEPQPKTRAAAGLRDALAGAVAKAKAKRRAEAASGEADRGEDVRDGGGTDEAKTAGWDRPGWLLASGLLWLAALFSSGSTPAGLGSGRTLRSLALLYPYLDVVAILAGLALLAAGYLRSQRPRDRRVLAGAMTLAALVQILAAIVLGARVYDGSGEGARLALLVGALSALSGVAGLVYLVQATAQLGRPRDDRPFLLVGAGALWLVAPFLPDDDYGGFDKALVLETFDDEPAIFAIGLLLAGVLAAAAGLMRHRSARTVWLITAAGFAGIMVIASVLLIVPMVGSIFFSESWDYEAASVLALASLTFALAYLTGAVRPALRRRRRAASPGGAGGG